MKIAHKLYGNSLSRFFFSSLQYLFVCFFGVCVYVFLFFSFSFHYSYLQKSQPPWTFVPASSSIWQYDSKMNTVKSYRNVNILYACAYKRPASYLDLPAVAFNFCKVIIIVHLERVKSHPVHFRLIVILCFVATPKAPAKKRHTNEQTCSSKWPIKMKIMTFCASWIFSCARRL